MNTTRRWDDVPFDLHPIIWRHVFEAERTERYRARELRFRFFGFIAHADREALWQGLNEWDRLRSCTHAEPHLRESLEEQILQRLEPRLSAVFHALFQPDTQDPVNQQQHLAGHAWTQTVFPIVSLRPEINDHNYVQRHGIRFAQILAASADGLHRISLRFTRFPVGGPYTSVNIQYVGPHRFRTFEEYNHHLHRGGTLEEVRSAPRTAGRPLNDFRVFEGWRR
jgi:hypothetical protein